MTLQGGVFTLKDILHSINMSLVLLLCLFRHHLDTICWSSSDCTLLYRQKAAEWSSDDETKELNAVAPALTPTERAQTENQAPQPCHSYKKSLRLSSDQIVRPRAAVWLTGKNYTQTHLSRFISVSVHWSAEKSPRLDILFILFTKHPIIDSMQPSATEQSFPCLC